VAIRDKDLSPADSFAAPGVTAGTGLNQSATVTVTIGEAFVTYLGALSMKTKPALLLIAAGILPFAAACGGSAHPSPSANPTHSHSAAPAHSAKPTHSSANKIPQNGGGDHDGDNSGGPSDGDGNV
jgi:hypothetical protein